MSRIYYCRYCLFGASEEKLAVHIATVHEKGKHKPAKKVKNSPEINNPAKKLKKSKSFSSIDRTKGHKRCVCQGRNENCSKCGGSGYNLKS